MALEAAQGAVSVAGARLRLVAEMIAPMLTAHRQALNEQVEAAVAALTDLDDLTRLDTELAAVKAAADQRVVIAELETTEAIQAGEVALVGQRAAEEGTVLARQGEQVALLSTEQAQTQLEDMVAELERAQTERDEALTATQVARDLVTGLRVEVAEATTLAKANALAAEQAEERVRAAVARGDEQVAHAEQRADATGAHVRELEVALAQARFQTGRA